MRHKNGSRADQIRSALSESESRRHQRLDFPIRPNNELLVRYILKRLDTRTEQELEVILTQDQGSRQRLIEAWRTIRSLATNPQDYAPESKLTRSLAAHWRKWSGPYVLPRWESPFVGRTAEIEQLLQLLSQADKRVVTIAGPGGMGKTRLACEIAMQVAERFRDGVLFVECGTLSRVDEVVSAIASSLGAEADSSSTVLQELLAEVRTLIVLDSCERIVGVGRIIEELAPNCQHTRWLITSHKPLNVAMETVIEVKPGQNQLDDCVKMLQEKLSRLVGELQHTPELIATLTTMCKRLHGVPLFVALAVGSLQPSQSAASSLKSLDLLTNLPPEAASLESEESPVLFLIRNEERHLLTQLLAFSGWFTLEEAAYVVEKRPEDALAILTDLARRERLDASFDGVHYRFKIPDPIVDGMSRSVLSATAQNLISKARERHAELFLRSSEHIGQLFDSGEWASASSLLQRQRTNLRAATMYLSIEGKHHEIATLSRALSLAYFESGYLTDFEILGNAARIAALATDDKALHASLLGLEGALAARKSDNELARSLWKQRLDICKQLGDIAKSADALIDLAWDAYENFGITPALAYLEEAESLVEEANLLELAATICVIRARMFIDAGDIESGLKWVGKTNNLIERCQNQGPLLFVYQNLVRAYQRLEMPDKLVDTLQMLLGHAVSGDRAVHIGWACQEFAQVFEKEGDLHRAAKYLVAAENVYREYRTRHLHKAKLAIEQFLSRHGDTFQDVVDQFKSMPWNDLIA
ncbi:MAG: NACHT domain-containing protein [Fimbriimonadaceae bacterium]|nr:NACHT domain-containing protein [Fimbriimonadaceae bacterium]